MSGLPGWPHLGHHLGERVAELVDGELDHDARDRALAHVAHCAECRAEVDGQRALKALLRGAGSPAPGTETVDQLLGLAAPGGPLPPRARSMPLTPLVPELPAPGRTRAGRVARRPRGRADARADGRHPDGRHPDGRHPGGRRLPRRTRLAAAGALSVAGLVLGTAFLAGGSTSAPVVPPVAELSVEHGRTSTAVTVGDPGMGLMVRPGTGVPVSGVPPR